jgi:hypothetical protein
MSEVASAQQECKIAEAFASASRAAAMLREVANR